MNSVASAAALLMIWLLCTAWCAAPQPACSAPQTQTPESAASSDTAEKAQTNAPVQRAMKGVIGGPHDFSQSTGRLRDACSACHVPHILGVRPAPSAGGEAHRPDGQSADRHGTAKDDAGRTPQEPQDAAASRSAQDRPEDVASRAMLELYRIEGQRGTFEADGFAPGPTSLICLSCHDGTVASSVMGTAHALLASVREGFEVPEGFVWRDHPIGVPYPARNRQYVPAARLEAQGRIRLPEGRVECVSCHDPHNAAGQPYLLSVSNRRSALCLSCHVK